MNGRIFIFLGVIVLLMSCYSGEDLEEKTLHKVLIIGNSITHHPRDLSIGWDAEWGMAASRPELDYVSVLTQSLRIKNPLVEVLRENVYPFERHYGNLDFNTYSHLRDFGADLLIVRLGENVDVETLVGDDFKESIRDFVEYLSGGRDVKVIVTTTFWEIAPVTDQMIKAAEESGWGIVHLSDLGEDDQYMAKGQFENEAVSRHPNDLGMTEIAKRIWEAVDGLP